MIIDDPNGIVDNAIIVVSNHNSDGDLHDLNYEESFQHR